jgi:SAM-dependent methyltransferase
MRRSTLWPPEYDKISPKFAAWRDLYHLSRAWRRVAAVGPLTLGKRDMGEKFEPIGDYREGHASRGAVYDATLSASAFDTYMTAWEDRHVRELVRHAFPQGVPRYLDFACGTGRMTQVVAQYAKDVVGVDISPTMLEAAQPKLPAARFVRADLTTESVELGQFDLISSFRFFGNADHELRRSVLRALGALARPGGYLLINNHRNPWACISMIDRLTGGTMEVDLTPRLLRRILSEAGFEIVAIRPIAVWQYRYGIAAKAGSNPVREERLERMFSSPIWANIAPDAVILARKNGTAA